MWIHARRFRKVKDPTLLDTACWLCDRYIQFGAPATLDYRQSVSVRTHAPTFGHLLRELNVVSAASNNGVGRNRYIHDQPDWVHSEPTDVNLDDYGVSVEGYYLEYMTAILELHQVLIAIQSSLTNPDNLDFKTYYLNKPKNLYTDAIELLNNLP